MMPWTEHFNILFLNTKHTHTNDNITQTSTTSHLPRCTCSHLPAPASLSAIIFQMTSNWAPWAKVQQWDDDRCIWKNSAAKVILGLSRFCIEMTWSTSEGSCESVDSCVGYLCWFHGGWAEVNAIQRGGDGVQRGDVPHRVVVTERAR